jgi:hypothetical protein
MQLSNCLKFSVIQMLLSHNEFIVILRFYYKGIKT